MHPNAPLLAMDSAPPLAPDSLVEQHITRLLGSLRRRPPFARHVGRYTVLGVLGRGGMGTVFDAYDPRLGRGVALKLLNAEVAKRHSQRLVREAKALARLSHPNVVQVYEVGEDAGRWFIAMELIEGESLRQWQDGRPSWQECVRVYLQAGEGLAAAHAQGLTHRDFKPDNCMIDRAGRVRVIDLGLAQGDHESTLDERASESMSAAFEVSTPRVALTRLGTLMGTPAYMPPEQWGAGPVDPRSDQFSFCVSLYESLYGERPLGGESLNSREAALMRGEPRLPWDGRRVPSKLRRILLRGLAPKPGDRWPSMDALLAALRQLMVRKTRRWLGLGLSLSLMTGLLVCGIGLACHAVGGCPREATTPVRVAEQGQRARELARAARHIYAQLGEPAAGEHAEVVEWLDAHPR